MVLETHRMFCVICEPVFFWKKNWLQNNGTDGPKLDQKFGFWVFLLVFAWIWSQMKVYMICYSCTNPIFGKNLVLESWARMLLANQIVRFLNHISPEQNDEGAWLFVW